MIDRRLALALSGGAAVIVFAAGLLTPPGLALAILYVPAVLPTIRGARRDPFLIAALCTLLAAVGAALHPGGGAVSRLPLLNAALATGATWVTALGIALHERSQTSLRDRESELRAILDTAIDGVITIDGSGVIRSANPAAERMFGYDPGELLGRNVRVLMPAPHDERHAGYVRRYLETGEARILGAGREVIGLRKDRTTLPIDLGVSEWLDSEPMFTAILRDLSERRRLEAEFRHAQKLEAIGRLAGGIAHDFNNLLMGVIACCRIARSTDDDGEVRAQVEEIQAAAERGAALTRQLLTFSRRKDLAPEPILIDEVVEHLETMLARLLGEHVELRVDLRAAHARVLIDPGQVEQILMNLAINGRDAMRQSGRLDVRTRVERCDRPGVDGVGGVGVGRYVALEVADDGCGMTDEVRAKAFDPFFTTKPPTEGSGLGLSTVYGLVRRSGGHLHVETEPGAGTRIALHLPLAEVEPTPRLRPAPAASADAASGGDERVDGRPQNATVLVCEDDRLVRAGVRHLLEQQGYAVLQAASGAEALRICEEHPGGIDLLLTDILMPRMTGGELAREVSARLPGVRRLFMSALPAEVLIEQGRIEEGDVALQKPFRDDDLRSAVRAALDEPSPPRA